MRLVDNWGDFHLKIAKHHPAGRLARLVSGVLTATAASLVKVAMARNLMRAAGTRADPSDAKARSATVRRDLTTITARTACHGRGNLILHLLQGHHRE